MKRPVSESVCTLMMVGGTAGAIMAAVGVMAKATDWRSGTERQRAAVMRTEKITTPERK